MVNNGGYLINLDENLDREIELSIITPSLNRAGFIEEAIQSVLDQDYPHVEHLIMDGGSTDGTLEVLARYPYLHVVSEPDNGIYDAINKGLKLARGDIIGLLNSDDRYESNIFKKIITVFEESPEIKALVGSANVCRKDEQGRWVLVNTIPSIPRTQLLQRATFGVPIINAWFFRKSVFVKLNGFCSSYSISTDRDFLIRYAKNGLPYRSVDKVYYSYLQHPESLTFAAEFDPEGVSGVENRAIAEKNLKDSELSPTYRNLIQSWHSDLTARQFLAAMRRKRLKPAARYLQIGWCHNIKWPIYVVSRIARGAQRRISMSIPN